MSVSHKVDVVGVGNPYMDLVINVTEMPPLDGATTANEIFNQGGGKVATALVAVARLGYSAGMLARVGGGSSGDFVIDDFSYNGVDTSRLLRGENGTTSPFCLSLSEEKSKTRIFIGKPKTASPLLPHELDKEYIMSARCLHLENGDETSSAAAEIAKSSGVTVCMDGDAYSLETEKLLPKIDVFIGSEFYFHKRYGNADLKEVCTEMRSKGPSVVIFTFGEKGCCGLWDGGYFEQPCFNVDVRDSTGAGDVFHGAYIAAMLDGKNPPECAKFASAVSAIKCTRIGGRTGIPTRQTAEKFISDGSIDGSELDERFAYYRNNL